MVVVAGETGSGKTTMLPLLCLEAGRGRKGVVCTQPRRIAATSIARYVSTRMAVPLGNEIGYRIRFDQKVTRDTCVTFMTDGILLTDMQRDRLLRRYDTIIIDEAHERSLNIDFLLGYLRGLLRKRRDLKLIISSATIDTELFSKAFDDAPIVEVSGRLYPVDIEYQPLDLDEDSMPEHYIDAAVRATENIIEASDAGDVLVFMPTQQDITEACEMLGGRKFPASVRILPLYGRLPARDQNRIFSRHSGRTVVIATNVAETSITVPGIRFVVDTGLARTMRYVPHLRTSRMPVEPVSQASANQRAGRAGRLEDGICIRLYGEDEFKSRDPYTTPEIKRTNLAGVVLQMHHMRLGRVDTFPFLEAPERRAITDGYALLTDLGALNRERRLTRLGKRMARLPLDPTIARMILQAGAEKALREVKVIAAGLSVVDPRERPQEKKALADASRKRFADPESDFMTYLNLWDAYQSEWKALRTQNRMRRFCREHFLSFNRMREWHDVHRQIHELCGRERDLHDNRRPADYDAVHRSLLAGLIHNVAMHVDRGDYRATRDRTVRVFPGSNLFRGNHPWIMCHEVVETSKVYARTAARIQPEWVEELAPELCRYTYAAPRFDQESGAVRAVQRVSFFGLPVVKGRQVAYSRIDPEQAHKVFVQEALVEGELRTHHTFLEHNAAVREKVDKLEAKLRTRALYIGDDALGALYSERAPGVASVHDLNKLIRSRRSDTFLRFRLEDLIVAERVPLTNLPDHLDIGGTRLKLTYRFAPTSEDDGITVQATERQFAAIHRHAFEWALPTLWPDRVKSLFEHLPRNLRRPLVPLTDSSRAVAAALTYTAHPFTDEVRRAARELYNVDIPAAAFNDYDPDPHLWVRVSVRNRSRRELFSFRPPQPPPDRTRERRAATDLNRDAFAHLLREGITEWDFGDLPERVEAPSPSGGMPLFAYPALRDDNTSVAIDVCSSPDEGLRMHRQGLARLFELTLAQDLAWEMREVRLSTTTFLALAPFTTKDDLQEHLAGILRDHFVEAATPPERTRAAFERSLTRKREHLRGSGMRMVELVDTFVGKLTAVREDFRRRRAKAGGSTRDLGKTLEADIAFYTESFIRASLPLQELEQFPRYLTALALRVQCAFEDPAKFRQRRKTLETYEQRYERLLDDLGLDHARRLTDLRMMIEEFGISLFAQQAVKTLYPVSEKRLGKRFGEEAGGG